MLSTAVILAALLAAPPAAPASSAKLPFPAPRLVQVTDATKCDFGTVLTVETANGRMQGMTKAGPVTYLVGPDVQVFSADGKPAGGIASVTVGAKYRAYYVIDGGAKVLEIDLVK
ncbi:MAG TPA: hypothetical protein VF841_11335 [Anaeromyxobacter sp.]